MSFWPKKAKPSMVVHCELRLSGEEIAKHVTRYQLQKKRRNGK